MNTTLLVVGFVFVAAAIIGGGLKAADIEVPVVNSIPRQVLLGLAGLGAIAISFLPAENYPASGTGTPSTTGSPLSVSLPPSVTIKNKHHGENSCVVYFSDIKINKAVMSQCADVTRPQRTWQVHRFPSGVVQFVSRELPHVCLGVNADNRFVVGTWECLDVNHSAWLVNRRFDGAYQLKNQSNQNLPQCLEAANEQLQLNDCNESDYQQWEFFTS